MNKKKHRFINGQKGFISLLLVVVLLPFYGVAAILEEIGRYEAGVRAMDEAGNIAAVSTLAEKDEFLYKRFGLLALDQSSKTTVDKTYLKYLKAQKTQSTNSFIVNDSDVSVNGVYSLGDIYTLEQEVMQYGAVRMPVKIASDMIDVDGIIKNLEENLGISQILKLVNACSDVVDATVKINNAADKINQSVSSMKTSYEDYKKAYEDWGRELKDYDTFVKSMTKMPTETTASTNPEDYKNADGTQMDSEQMEAERQKRQTDIDNQIKKAQEDEETRKTKAGNVDKARDIYKEKTSDLAVKLDAVDKETTNQIDALGGFVAKSTISVVDASYNYKKEEYKKNSDAAVDQKAEELTKADPSKKKVIDEIAAAQKDQTDTAVKNAETVEGGIKDSGKGAVDYAIMQLGDYKTEVDTIKGKLVDQEKRIKGKPNIDAEHQWASYSLTPETDYYNTDAEGYTDPKKIEDLLVQKGVKAAFETAVSFLAKLADCVTFLNRTDLFYDPHLDVTINSDFFNQLPSRKPGRVIDNNPFAKEDKNAALNNIKAYTGEDYQEIQPDQEFDEFENAFNKFFEWQNRFIAAIVDLGTLTISAPFEVIKIVHDLKTVKVRPDNICLLMDENQYDGLSKLGKAFFSTTHLMNAISNLEEAISKLTASGGSIGAAIAKTLAKREVFMAYLCYKLANRTNYDSVSGEGGTADVNIAPLLTTNRTGNEKAFAGCELEYICFGEQAEIENQFKMARMLYGIRLFVDIASIFTNREFLNLLDALTPIPFAAPIYALLVVIGEPVIDVLFLVNGEKIPLYKGTIYLTPSGIATKFVDKLCKIAETKAEKAEETRAKYNELNQKLNEAVKKHNDTSNNSDVKSLATTSGSNGKTIALQPPTKEADDFLEFSYMQYAFITMSLVGNKTKYLQRLQDIIVMEANQYNSTNQTYVQKHTGEVDAFDIDKAYTCLRTKTTGNFKPVLPVPTISSLGVLRYESVNYRGY